MPPYCSWEFQKDATDSISSDRLCLDLVNVAPLPEPPSPYVLSLTPKYSISLSPHFLLSVLCVPLLDFGRLTFLVAKACGDASGSG